MSKTSSLGPLEKAIMDVVWKKGKVKVKDVLLELKTPHTLAYTTVLTVMSRLWKKGLLLREKKGKTFLYAAQSDKKHTIQAMIHSALDSLIDRYGDEAIAAFVDEVKEIKDHTSST